MPSAIRPLPVSRDQPPKHSVCETEKKCCGGDRPSALRTARPSQSGAVRSRSISRTRQPFVGIPLASHSSTHKSTATPDVYSKNCQNDWPSLLWAPGEAAKDVTQLSRSSSAASRAGTPYMRTACLQVAKSSTWWLVLLTVQRLAVCIY